VAGEQIDKLTLLILVKSEEEVSATLNKVDAAAKATAASVEKVFGATGAAATAAANQGKQLEANMKRLGLDAKELDKQLGRNIGEHMRLPVLTKALQDTDKAFDEFQSGAKVVPDFLDRAGAAAAKANQGFTLLAAGTNLPGVEANMKRLGQNFKELQASSAASFTDGFKPLASGTIITGVEQNMKRLGKDFAELQQQSAADFTDGFKKLASGTKIPGLDQNMKRLASDFKELNKQGGTEALAAAQKAKRGYSLTTQGAKDAAAAVRVQTAASLAASETLSRELGGALVTVGGHFGRLGGVTTTFAQTLGRQTVRGTSEAVGGITALLTRTQRLRAENERYVSQFKSLVTLPIQQRAAEFQAAEAINAKNVAMIDAQASAAGMGLAVGGATIAIALAAVAGAGLIAVLKQIAEKGIEVSKAFDIVALRSGGKSLDDFRKQVFAISAQTGFSFEELAQAQGKALLKMGGDAQKAAQLLDVAGQTALAAFTSPERAVEHLGDLMRNYQLEIGRVKDASNALLILQRTAREDFDALAGGIGTVVPVARELGIQFDDLISSVAGMAASGLSAQQAIFGLRTDLANLTNPSSAISKEMRRLGVDISAAAFRAKGLVPVLREMDAALRKDGTSLAEFFGESRKSGPIFALLGDGGRKAAKALDEMRSGADQSAKSTKDLQTPMRQFRNLLVELDNAQSQFAATLTEEAVPALLAWGNALKDSIGFVKDMARQQPLLTKAIEGYLSAMIPAVAVTEFFSRTAEPAAKGFSRVIAGAREFFGLTSGAAAKPREIFSQLDAQVQVLIASGIKLGAAFGPALAKVRSDAFRAAEALQGFSDRARTQDFIKRMDDLRDSFGNATQFLLLLTLNVERSGKAQAIVTELTRNYARASEKTADDLAKAKAQLDAWTFALRVSGADISGLILGYERWRRAQDLIISGQKSEEAAFDRADAAIQSIAASSNLAAEKVLELQVALRGTFASLAKRNDLLSKKTSGTDPEGKESVQAIIDNQERIQRAYDDSKASVLEFNDVTSRTQLGALELQLSRAREAAEQFKDTMPALSIEMQKFADDFERIFVQPQRNGFAGGFKKGIDDFIKHAKDQFEVGKELAAEFADSFTSAIQNLLLSIGTGKAALRNFAVAVLQSIEQMIAKFLALKIAAGVLGFLFDGGGTATVHSSGTTVKDTGGVETYDVGGQRALDRGGVNSRPTAFVAPFRRGMTEAFVPLPGPNRGIPVEFRNGGRGGGGVGPVHITFNIESHSVDPRGADELIVKRLPMIIKGVAGAIEGRRESTLIAAIRGVGR
jgi:TP901 family phage tail tape measure protein